MMEQLFSLGAWVTGFDQLNIMEHAFLMEQKPLENTSYLLGSLETVTFSDSPKRLLFD